MIYEDADQANLVAAPNWKWAVEPATYGRRFSAGYELARIRSNAWGSKTELIREALMEVVDGAAGDGAFDALNLPIEYGDDGELRSYRLLAEWSRTQVQQDSEKYGHLPQTSQEWNRVADAKIQELFALNQAIIASARRNDGAATLGGIASGLTDEVGVASILIGMVAGPTVGVTRTLAFEGAFGAATSFPVTAEERDTARRTGEEEPGYLKQAAFDAAFSMAIPGTVFGGVAAYRGVRGVRLGYAKPPESLPPRQPTSGLDDAAQQAAEKQTVRALTYGDTSLLPDTTEEAVAGLRAGQGRGGRFGQFLPQSELPRGGHGVQREAMFALARLEGIAGRTFKVISARRDPATNEAVGGARRSQHLHGNAFDIDVSDLSRAERIELIRMAREAGFGGVGVYANSLHFDVGAVRHWGADFSASSLPDWAREAVGTPVGSRSPGDVDAGQQASASSQQASAAEVVEAGRGYTVIRMSDGRTVRREGSRAWRNNNPGNIEYGDFARSQGAVGTDGRFAVFPTYEAGRAAKAALIFESGSYRSLPLSRAIARYAPQFENDTDGYLRQVADAAGVSPSTRMSDLTPEQRVRVLDAMERVEGFRPGTEDGVQAARPTSGAVSGPSDTGPATPAFDPSRMMVDTDLPAEQIDYVKLASERAAAIRESVIDGAPDLPDMPSPAAPSRYIEPEPFQRAPPGTKPPGSEPMRLKSFIVKMGGIYRGDDTGELAALEYRRRDFLVKDPLRRSAAGESGGRTVDEMREAAAEAGYLPQDSSVADFLDLVRRDVEGERIVSIDDMNEQAVWDDYYRDLEYRKMRAEGIDLYAELGAAREASRSEPRDTYIDLDGAYFDQTYLTPEEIRQYVANEVYSYVRGRFRPEAFSEAEIEEIIDDIAASGGDVEIAFEDMALRERDDMVRIEQEYDDGIAATFGNEDRAGEAGSDAADDYSRGYSEAFGEAGPASGGARQGGAGADDPVWSVSEAQQRTELPGRDLDPELDRAADEALADFARQFEMTPDGEQALIDGVEPVTKRDRLQALQNALLDGGRRTDDSQIGGLFDLNQREIDDLFSIEMEDGRKVSPVDAVREAEADADFLDQLKYCREGE